MLRDLGLSIAVVAFVSGCLVVGQRDDFEYVCDGSYESGHFVPPSYIAPRKQNVYLPFVWIFNEEPPHDLALDTFDPSYLRTSKPFETIVLESLQIEYRGETPIDLVSLEQPLEQRTHKVAHEQKEMVAETATVVFKGAITRRDNFILKLRGHAIDKQGQQHPFEARGVYQFKERRWSWGPLTA